MPKIYERNPIKMMEKGGLINHNFKGQHMDDIIAGAPIEHRCRFCGQVMIPLKNYHYAIIWGCRTSYCPNNQDNPLKFDVNAAFINNAGNTNRLWDEWRPRRIV